MANETKIDTLSIDIDYSAGTANTGLTSLMSTLEKLTTVTAGSLSGLKSVSSQLNRFNKVTQTLDSTKISQFASNITGISSAVKPLTELGKSNLGSFINQLKKLPELNKTLDANTISQFTVKIKELSNAMLPLANNMAKVTAGFSSLPSKLNKVSSYTAKASKSVSILSSISGLLNFGAIFATGRMVGNYLSDFITSSNAYIENLNLFTVAMGESTEKAKEWIGTVTDALGIEPGGMMRYMGVFQMMANGFGMSADNAYKMSKNLTQLTYDIASFYNLNIDEAAQKVQSAFAGELEPVRRLGYALDQATLKQIALNNGIEESFTNMSQAEKAQLRYIALLTQNQQVQGDMGRTIMSSANAIRVLKQQFVILGREIGNIFIPLLMKIVPTAIAVVRVLSKVAKAIASLLGFELPDLNWDSVSIGADIGDGVADSLDDASGSAKRLKRQLAGFDELNNLTSPTPSSGVGAGGGVGGADFELDLPEYDMLEGFTKGIDDLTDKIMKFFGITEDSLGKLSWSWNDMAKEAKTAAVILGAIAGVKVLGALTNGFNTLKTIFKTLGGTKLVSWIKKLSSDTVKLADGTKKLVFSWKNFLKIIGKITSVITGVILAIKGVNDIQKVWKEEIFNTEKVLGDLTQAQIDAGKAAAELAAGGALIGLAFGGPIGAAIGAVVGALGALGLSIYEANKAYKNFVITNAEGYGTLELTAEQLKMIGETITSTSSATANSLATLQNYTEQSNSAIQSSINTLNEYAFNFSTAAKKISEEDAVNIFNSIETLGEKANKAIDTSTNAMVKVYSDAMSTLGKLNSESTQNNITEIINLGEKRKKYVDEYEQKINEIWKNAIDTRGYLTSEESRQILQYQQKINELTNTDAIKQKGKMLALQQQLNSDMTKLTKQGLEELATQIDTSHKEATDTIRANYEERLGYAEMHSQLIYEDAIRAGKNEEDALKEKNNKLEELQREYYKTYEKELQTQEETVKQMRMDYANSVQQALDELNKKGLDKLTEDEKIKREAYQETLRQFNIDMYQIQEDAKKWGQSTGLGYAQNWRANSALSTPNIPDISSSAKTSGQNAANSFNKGWKDSLSLVMNTLPSAIRFKTQVENDGNVSLKAFNWYAQGGFPSTGEFFLAREAGPELVGRIGNKTAVANNDQIVAGIQQGVYNAMVNAQIGQQNGGTIVNIGNKQVYRSFSNGLKTENNRLGTSAVRV